ncbi:DUF3943 domain-containing protein [Bdellovibrio sp. HCB209]|uniref:DUF3943 domain-containing protein n=1 Tax=Bdellovibrio sp. HCB209 TaxID=3394354 RepID=UPI0039B3AB72
MLISRKFFKSLLLSVVVLFGSVVHAEDTTTAESIHKKPTGMFEEYKHIPKTEFAEHEKLKNFGIMYGLQWIVYIGSQHETIKSHGSWHNFFNNPFHPDYDKDTFDYNIFKHSLSGELYYQYYRSRGYIEQDAFLWAVTSSLAFEFAIETVTEVPSLQDIYLTPVLGTIVGFGFEKLSLYFHSKKTWPNRLLGYVFNPFTILPDSRYGYVAMPIVSENFKGVQVSWSFE